MTQEIKKTIISTLLTILVVAVTIILFKFKGQEIFGQPTNTENPEVKQVELYYYNPTLDQDDQGNIQCSRTGLSPVTRFVSKGGNEIHDTINLLLSGQLTNEEREHGITTEFPLDNLTLTNIQLEDGILTLTFDDPMSKTSGGSCRAGILWFQIEATAKQFPGVNEVKFMPEELFQP